MLSKLLSRKFLLALVALLAKTLFGVDLPPELLALVGTYVVGESAVDVARQLAERAQGHAVPFR